MSYLTIFFFLIFSSLSGFVQEESFLPENDLSIPIQEKISSGLTEVEFHSTIDELTAMYRPIIEPVGKLEVEKLWQKSEVNAYARRLENNVWQVTFTGGLARHKHMTRDAFSLVICHELGHHLGGAPTHGKEKAWASAEGQADYFATSKCLRRLWEKDDNGKIIERMIIPQGLKSGCDRNWFNQHEKDLCVRSGVAAEAIGKLLASTYRPSSPYRRVPRIITPDQTQVSATHVGHPKPQCRLDTFYQGSLCHVPFAIDFDSRDEIPGSCDSRQGDHVGIRPSCWFTIPPGER